MIKIFELIKSISPEIVTAIIIALIFYFTKEFKKVMKLFGTITTMAKDIKAIREMMPHIFCRLDAQDCSTKELFNALKNQKVNGEAAAAIKVMDEAKKNSDEFMSKLIFEEKRNVI